MPNKAFLHKKSLIDKFRDDHKKGTGYIQAARARRTWNNPMTRRKRTNKLNDWITSFAGKRHIRKLSRFNALKESNTSMDDTKAFIKYTDDVLDILTTKYDVSKDELKSPLFMDMFDYIDSYWYLEKTPEDCAKHLSKVFSLKSKSEAKDTEEKLGYEKGHKNSRGEDAPWVIRSHKDNRVLASFASEEDAKEHLKRMKQFSKDESMEPKHGVVMAIKKDGSRTASLAIDTSLPSVEKEYAHALKIGKFLEVLPTAYFNSYDAAKNATRLWIRSGIKPNQNTHKSEAVKLTYVDTIRVPQWMWVADQTGDTSDLEDDEIEMLKEFQQEYKDKHLDDKGEDPYFSSRNDFDSLGGNVYDIDVYEMDTKAEAVNLTYVDTIRVPQWLWVAYQTNDPSDLEYDELDTLETFKQEYASKYHMDNKGEEAYFSSRNDFNNLGGNVYDVDLYEMDTKNLTR